MTAVFLDTSYLVALLRRRDVHHGDAVRLREIFEGPLITTEYILVETLDSLTVPALRSAGAAAVRDILGEERIRLIPAARVLLDEGLLLFESRPDKDWGLTDCISFIVMRAEGVAEALTADRHFEQAGFRALMRERS